jgi:hypothetical protein
VQLVGDGRVLLAVLIISISCRRSLILSRSISICRPAAHRPLAMRIVAAAPTSTGIALEEGAGGQIVGDVGLGDALHAGRGRLAHRFSSFDFS